MSIVNDVLKPSPEQYEAAGRRRAGRAAYRNQHLIEMMRNAGKQTAEPQSHQARVNGKSLRRLCAASLLAWVTISLVYITL
jgi:hypothetical protein